MSATTARFAGRRAIVTGASRGIGAGIAQRLAAEGADVAITARTLDRHPTLNGRFGGQVALIAADLGDEEEDGSKEPRSECPSRAIDGSMSGEAPDHQKAMNSCWPGTCAISHVDSFQRTEAASSDRLAVYIATSARATDSAALSSLLAWAAPTEADTG